jgi:predicted nicotinamide N-methyase
MTPEEVVGQTTAWAAVPFVGEITIRMPAAPSGLWDLWDETGREPPPFWAFPWAGGQALARYILDHPDVVRGRRVLDVASGSGLVAIAAARAGRRHRPERGRRDRRQCRGQRRRGHRAHLRPGRG